MENNANFKAEWEKFSLEVNLNSKQKPWETQETNDLWSLISKAINLILELWGKKISIELSSKK